MQSKDMYQVTEVHLSQIMCYYKALYSVMESNTHLPFVKVNLGQFIKHCINSCHLPRFVTHMLEAQLSRVLFQYVCSCFDC